MKEVQQMRKRLILLMLLTVLIIGCQEMNVLSKNEYDRGKVEVQENGNDFLALLIESTREFDVSPGEYGYFAIRYIEHMQEILPNRLAFTDRELETAEWIIEMLLEMGFDESQVEIQNFDINKETSSWWGDSSWLVEYYEYQGYYDGLKRIDTSQNVILTVPGRSEETIIIGAHYDSMNNSGISDNAGGVALLLENVYRMRHVDHYYTLQYVFFGAHEVGLIGTFYFADNLSEEDNLVLMINADVLMDGPDLRYAIGYVDGLPENPEELFWGTRPNVLKNELTLSIDEIAAELNENYGTELIAEPQAIFLSTDQMAFLQFEVPVMVFYGTYPIEYPNLARSYIWHSPSDDLDFIIKNHPGRIERALNSFGRFLEAVLSSEF